MSSSCPEPKILEQFLLENFTGESLTAHINGCPRCQQELDDLLGKLGDDLELSKHLRGPGVTDRTQIQQDLAQKLDLRGELDPMDDEPPFPPELMVPSDYPGAIGRVGNYELLQLIGRGGMGTVFKAFDPGLHRIVAIKFLAPHLAHNPRARKRFIREAQAAAAVSHDHVVTTYAIDESGEQPALVMQYVPGRSLQQKLDVEGPLPLLEILRIGSQAAAGIAAAHAQGLVHRDIRPANILLENGIQRVRLTDFGLARAEDDHSLTASHVIVGTPHYMAPEQARGENITTQADLFSLGSVLYAMSVGTPPFQASTTMGVLNNVCEATPRRIRERNPEIPEWFEQIVMRLLQKSPADRLASAREVAELLGGWLAHLQQPLAIPAPEWPACSGPDARPDEHQQPITRWPVLKWGREILQQPSLRKLLGAGIAILLMVLLTWGIQLLKSPQILHIPDSVQNVGRSDVRSARLSTGGALLAATGGSENNGFIKIWNAQTDQEKALQVSPSVVSSVAFGDHGKVLATGESDGCIRIRNATTGIVETELQGHTGEVTGLVFHPTSGDLVSYGIDGRLCLWRGAQAPPRELLGLSGLVTDARYTRDGSQIVACSHDKKVHFWSWLGEEINTLGFAKIPVKAQLDEPDGQLVVAFEDGECMVWSLKDKIRRGRWKLNSAPTCLRTAYWSQRQTGVFLTSTPDGQIHLHGFEDHREIVTLRSSTEAIEVDLIGPGDRIASVHRDGLVRIWNLNR